MNATALAVYNKQDRFIGRIEGDTFIKEVYTRHQLRKPPAWCIDAEPFDKLIKPSCRYIRIIDKEKHRQYLSTTANFVENKGEIERGFGKQYFMILEKWEVK